MLDVDQVVGRVEEVRLAAVGIRGRASTLTVNYRTSHQIRRMADRLLPSNIKDADGIADDRDRTVSTFDGPVPQVQRLPTAAADEIVAVTDWLKEVVAQGTLPSEVGIFVRNRAQLDRARAAVAGAGATTLELANQDQATIDRIAIGTIHLAKGLEFKAVAVMACDDDVLPLQSRIEAVADEVELDEVYATERHLFYVACTRARDRLLISDVSPGSEFLEDLN